MKSHFWRIFWRKNDNKNNFCLNEFKTSFWLWENGNRENKKNYPIAKNWATNCTTAHKISYKVIMEIRHCFRFFSLLCAILIAKITFYFDNNQNCDSQPHNDTTDCWFPLLIPAFKSKLNLGEWFYCPKHSMTTNSIFICSSIVNRFLFDFKC